jgi:uncharacterized protein (DUF433 family)
MDTATSSITRIPGVCGGEARVRATRHTVHGLVEWKRLGVSDEKLLTMFDPPLTQDDLDAAWRYADEHPGEIERALWADRAVMIEHGPSAPPPAGLIAEGRRLGLSDEAIREAFEPPLAPEEWAAAIHRLTGAA